MREGKRAEPSALTAAVATAVVAVTATGCGHAEPVIEPARDVVGATSSEVSPIASTSPTVDAGATPVADASVVREPAVPAKSASAEDPDAGAKPTKWPTGTRG